jgi:flagellar basal-body rod modification protein FlgD
MSTTINSADPFSNSSGVAAGLNADGTRKQSDPKTEFLSLLVTQLKNQDPNNPVDQTQMLAQLAQFSSLEQMQSLNTTMTASASISNLSQSASLIGKTVTLTDPKTGATTNGVVGSVNVVNGNAQINVGGINYNLSSVTAIK